MRTFDENRYLVWGKRFYGGEIWRRRLHFPCGPRPLASRERIATRNSGSCDEISADMGSLHSYGISHFLPTSASGAPSTLPAFPDPVGRSEEKAIKAHHVFLHKIEESGT